MSGVFSLRMGRALGVCETHRAAELTVYAWQCLLERPKQRAQPRQQKDGRVHENSSSPLLYVYVCVREGQRKREKVSLEHTQKK